MNVDTMRRIDRLAGVPLRALATLVLPRMRRVRSPSPANRASRTCPLYAQAALMVSNDSGPAHFSAATRLPTIVLFGPETPKLYQPLGNSRSIYAGLACSPCVTAHNHRKTACRDCSFSIAGFGGGSRTSWTRLKQQ